LKSQQASEKAWLEMITKAAVAMVVFDRKAIGDSF
jgi:hypothetical protein